jgi:hypothetical protein
MILINKLFFRDDKIFKSFEEFIKYFDEKNTITIYNTETIGESQLNYTINNEIQISFREGHANYSIMNKTTYPKNLNNFIIRNDILMSLYYVLFDKSENNKNLLMPFNETTIYQISNESPFIYNNEIDNIHIHRNTGILKFYKFIDISKLNRKENILSEILLIDDGYEYSEEYKNYKPYKYDIIQQIFNNRELLLKYFDENEKNNQIKTDNFNKFDIIYKIIGDSMKKEHVDKKISLFKKIFYDEELKKYINYKNGYMIQCILTFIDYTVDENNNFIDDLLQYIPDKKYINIEKILILDDYLKRKIILDKLVKNDRIPQIDGRTINNFFTEIYRNIKISQSDEKINSNLDTLDFILDRNYFEDKDIITLFSVLDFIWEKKPFIIKKILSKYQNSIKISLDKYINIIENQLKSKDLYDEFLNNGIKFDMEKAKKYPLIYDQLNKHIQTGGNNLYKDKYLKYKQKYLYLKQYCKKYYKK